MVTESYITIFAASHWLMRLSQDITASGGLSFSPLRFEELLARDSSSIVPSPRGRLVTQ